MPKSNLTSSWNADLIDEMHGRWQQSPDSLDPEWKAFFEGFELGSRIEQNTDANSHKRGDSLSSKPISEQQATKQARFIGLIYAYRSLGHTIANFNPLAKEANTNPRLTLERLGFDASDLDSVFDSGNYLGGIQLSLRELIERLEKTYCRTVGFEYLHIQETAKRRWIQARIEPECFEPRFSTKASKDILRNIIEGEAFEEFLQSKFLGQKRFSLEGGETLIAILDSIFQRCGKNKVDEIVMGMAHRGRLNVLGNFLGKS
ncbi:MAG: 2-oxoglutarate dehydrogenase E1 component, partial [Puniceicoccaceae bacterium]|nr:2-oxoglutarate dehydrogenase E1 component [Puniceicoccaceae bacterium]